VHFIGVGSIVFPWREWDAASDPYGPARVVNLPIGEDLWFHVRAPRHRLRKADRDFSPKAKIESGRRTRVEIVLEKTVP
jgi:hypothetical protein